MPAGQAITIERSSRASLEEVWELGTTPKGVPSIRSVPEQTLHTDGSRWCHSPTSTPSGRSNFTRMPR
jgi:uncharacterized protein YndB with AHSA1/START domain